MRSMFFFTAKYNVTIVAQHIPEMNNGTDALSRNDLMSFLMQVNGMNRKILVTLPQLLEGLILQAPDRTLLSWTRSLHALWQEELWIPHTEHIIVARTATLKFCSEAGLMPVPTTEQILCWFITVCSSETKTLHHKMLFISCKISAHFGGQEQSISIRICGKGIKGECVARKQQRTRLPISQSILRKIKAVWQDLSSVDQAMLWAACCLDFFGFMRAGNFLQFLTVQSMTQPHTCSGQSREPFGIELRVVIKQ